MAKINKSKVIRLANKCIDALNEEDLTEDEMVLALAQLLIRSGKTIYDPKGEISFDKIDWIELNKEYYQSEERNIGLGLLLNGGQMMEAVNFEDDKSSKKKKKSTEKKEGKEDATDIQRASKNSQKTSRTTSKTSKTKNRRNSGDRRQNKSDRRKRSSVSRSSKSKE